MNAKVFIVALCAVQLVSGGIIEDTQAKLISQFSPIADQARQAASAFQQQAQNAFQNASSSVLSQFEAALSSIQQNITAQISSAQAAEPNIQACLKNQEEKYAEILNSTQKQLQDEFQAQLTKLQPVTDKLNAIIKNVTNVPSNFEQCVGRSLLAALNIPKCSIQSAANFTSLSKELATTLQSGLQALNQSDASNSTATTLQSAAAEYQDVDEETRECVQEAVASSGTAEDPSTTADGSSDTTADPTDTSGSA